MASNPIDLELKSDTELEVKSEFSTDSVINEIISKSLESRPLLVDPAEAEIKDASSEPAKQARISFRTLGNIVLVLNSGLRQSREPRETDVVYWRTLARGMCEENERYKRVVEIQRQRIDILERDLRALVSLARETQQMLALISTEKRSSQERGHGEHAD